VGLTIVLIQSFHGVGEGKSGIAVTVCHQEGLLQFQKVSEDLKFEKFCGIIRQDVL